MSKEPVKKTAPPISAIKILPLHISKLIKEDDEETWISGEELYTEGSSDEESCKCKHELFTEAGKDLSLASSKSHQSKNKARTQSPLANVKLASLKSEVSSNNASEEDEDVIADDEISWKANKDEELLNKEILVLHEYQKELEIINQSANMVYNDFIKEFKYFQSIENDLVLKKNDNIVNEIKNSINLFDLKINKLQDQMERIKQQTKHIQLQNRLRLKEIINKSPSRSKKLADNTKCFMDLYDSQ